MELGYKLTAKQQQKIVMTQELMQSIQILQYSSQELENFIEEELMVNPVLERDDRNQKKDKISREEAIRQYIDEYGGQRRRTLSGNENGDTSSENYLASEKTLKDYLIEQLQFSCNSEEENKIGLFIIESLDPNGYMTIETSEISYILKVNEEKIRGALEKIQQFEPIGVGSQSLSQCLAKQLAAKGLLTREMEEIVTNCMDELANNRLACISKKIGVPIGEVQKMVDIVKSLEPKPGARFSENENTSYIIPDVYILKSENGGYAIETNQSATPSLMVSAYYKKLLKENKSDESLKKYLAEKVESGIGIVRSIEQRQETIKNVAEIIVDYQMEFFARGEKYLKPLTQKNIADKLGIHESTVSRTIHGKYLQSHRGTYEFKYFLSSGVVSDKGDEVSSKSIKKQMMEIIETEDIKKPFSDQQIVELFKERNVALSRRTVAKYRDEMMIPSSSKRKRY